MSSDKLYELAFKYRKTGLWKKLCDTEMFAVKFSNGETGYINITGMEGGYNALEVYVGGKAYNSYIAATTLDKFNSASPLFYQEIMLQQDCLQCAFHNKDALTETGQKKAGEYAHRHGISLKGRNSYPQFRKYQPECFPWQLEEEQDEKYLTEALGAAVEMAKILETKSLSDVGIKPVTGDARTIPILELKDGHYQISRADLPDILPVQYIVPDVFNDINAAKLKGMKKMGIWECELVQYPVPVQNTPDEVPHFPMIFLAAESGTGFILPILPVEHFKENPGELINIIVDAFLAQSICPKVMKVRDERSYHLLEALCKRLKTGLKIESELPLLSDVEAALVYQWERGEEEEMQDIMDALDKILELDDENLQSLPENLSQRMDKVFHLKKQGSEAKLVSKIKTGKTKTGNIKKRKGQKVVSINPVVTQAVNSYIISVSCGTGCYRHIQISENSTLFELHSAILCAFEFYDDHAHAFFMDNKIWSEKDAYYVKGMAECHRYTCDYKLNQAGLKPGKQFKYVFDFGDEWLFQCKVLCTIDENTEIPFVKRSKGKAPEQYSDWDE